MCAGKFKGEKAKGSAGRKLESKAGIAFVQELVTEVDKNAHKKRACRAVCVHGRNGFLFGVSAVVEVLFDRLGQGELLGLALNDPLVGHLFANDVSAEGHQGQRLRLQPAPVLHGDLAVAPHRRDDQMELLAFQLREGGPQEPE